jgi:26S proteasome regulatory subunit N2
MSRVLPSQLRYISFKEESRYKPIKKQALGGIVMLVDSTPNAPRDLIVHSVPKVDAPANSSGAAAVDENEPAPPEPFEYIESP